MYPTYCLQCKPNYFDYTGTKRPVNQGPIPNISIVPLKAFTFDSAQSTMHQTLMASCAENGCTVEWTHVSCLCCAGWTLWEKVHQVLTNKPLPLASGWGLCLPKPGKVTRGHHKSIWTALCLASHPGQTCLGRAYMGQTAPTTQPLGALGYSNPSTAIGC